MAFFGAPFQTFVASDAGTSSDWALQVNYERGRLWGVMLRSHSSRFIPWPDNQLMPPSLKQVLRELAARYGRPDPGKRMPPTDEPMAPIQYSRTGRRRMPLQVPAYCDR